MDVLIFLLYLAGFIVSIVVVVAVCQLFAIRRLLEQLVRQQSVTEPVGAVAPAAPTPEQIQEWKEFRARDKRSLLIAGAVVVALAIALFMWVH